jgi:hypothetical protein
MRRTWPSLPAVLGAAVVLVVVDLLIRVLL